MFLEDLRLELIRKFRTQSKAAQALEIRDAKISRILHGFERPNDKERQKLEKAFGKPLIAKFFPVDAEEQHV